MDCSQICITSNEISQDFYTALEIGTSWGIRHFELKKVMNARVPDLDEGTVKRMKEELPRFDADVVCISPGMFMGVEIGTEKAKEQAGPVLDRTIAFAEGFGARLLICWGFARPEGTDPEATAPQEVIDVLGDVASRAGKAGMTMVIENGPKDWTNAPPGMLDVLGRVGAENLKLNWDPANYSPTGGTPYPDAYEQIAEHVAHVHLKDVAQLGPLDPMGHDYRVIGQGVIDWQGQLQALADNGYEGYLDIETHRGPFVANSHGNFDALTDMLSKVS